MNSPRSLPLRAHAERRAARRRECRRRASRRLADRPKVCTRLRARVASAAASGLSTPSSVSPLRGTRLTSRRNASRTSSMSAIDVGVIELDVVDDGDVGQVLQELRGLVEVGAVVLVAFDDERLALADAVAGAVVAEIPRDAADEHRRIGAGRGQQPPGQRGGRGLAVRAGDHDRVRVPQPLIANRFRQRRVANAAIEHSLELRVAARNGIADHDQIERGVDVLGAIAFEHVNPLSGKKVAHRRIDVLIGAADVDATMLQQRRQRGHRRAADADQVNRVPSTRPLPPRIDATDGVGPRRRLRPSRRTAASRSARRCDRTGS